MRGSHTVTHIPRSYMAPSLRSGCKKTNLLPRHRRRIDHPLHRVIDWHDAIPIHHSMITYHPAVCRLRHSEGVRLHREMHVARTPPIAAVRGEIHLLIL